MNNLCITHTYVLYVKDRTKPVTQHVTKYKTPRTNHTIVLSWFCLCKYECNKRAISALLPPQASPPLKSWVSTHFNSPF